MNTAAHKYKFLITGAHFANKGAESMLYVTTDELRKRFPSCNIYFAVRSDYPQEIYTFKKIFYSPGTLRIAFGGFDAFIAMCKETAKHTVKFLLGRHNTTLIDCFALSKCIAGTDAIIDISGYALSSKFKDTASRNYLKRIMLAEKFKVPVYLMPQSFGPFGYAPEVMSEFKPLMQKLLTYPRIIFAREKEGYDSLTELFGLKNVRLSADLVLQNSGIEIANVFRIPPVISVPKIESQKELAGIVPNMKCFVHGNKDEILRAYTEIIKYILSQGYKVILFRHSREDIEACAEIKKIFADDENVIVIENEFSCLEYNEFVKQFEFLVCSRYHGLVHAYKNNIPCVALGWAVKYKRLAENLNQGSYVFDITGHVDTERIIHALRELINNYDDEKKKIRERLAMIQKNNCFDAVEEDIKRLAHE